MTTVADALQAQFKQDTGRALCDSGGEPQYDEDGNYTGSKYGYGRRYEKLQNVDLSKSPEFSLDFRYGLEVTRSAFHPSQASVFGSTLDLVTHVTLPGLPLAWRRFASSQATRAIRSAPRGVTTLTAKRPSPP